MFMTKRFFKIIFLVMAAVACWAALCSKAV